MESTPENTQYFRFISVYNNPIFLIMRIELPTSWDKVNIKQFIELTLVKQRCEDPVDIMVETIAILSNTERQKICQVSLKDLSAMFAAVSFIGDPQFGDKVKDVIKLNGKYYRANLDVTKMNAGQYASLKHYCKDVIGNLHNIMAIFYRPVNNAKEDHNVIAEEFLNEMSIKVAYPLAVFFWTLSSAWMNHLETCLSAKTQERIMKMTMNNSQMKNTKAFMKEPGGSLL